MSTLIFEVPEDSDFWPCPEGCGGATEDPYGGPCKRCWSKPAHDVFCPGVTGFFPCDCVAQRG